MNIVNQIEDILKDDVLFNLIKDRPKLYDILIHEDYLQTINTKQYYPLSEIAIFFNATDGQIRYYIKPFFDYIFLDEEDTPLSETIIRLSFKSLLRVRMLLLLKEEFRVKGLKQVLEHTPKFIQRSSSEDNKPAVNNDEIMHIVSQILQSGIYELSNEGGEVQVKLSPKLSEALEYNKDERLRLEAENQKILVDLQATQETLKNIKNEHINFFKDKETYAEWEIEAAEEFEKKNNYGALAKLFKRDAIEIEKKKFILEYIKTKKETKL